MRFARGFLILLGLSPTTSASWNGAKNAADDIVYSGITATFYCGCTYKSDGDSDGSGKITDTKTCGYVGPAKHSHRAGRVEWEHIVPASLMPARQFECWRNPPNGQSGRSHCEKSARATAATCSSGALAISSRDSETPNTLSAKVARYSPNPVPRAPWRPVM